MRYLNFRWHWYALFILLVSGITYYLLPSPWSIRWLDDKDFWYSLLWKGEKVGYVHINYNQLDNNVIEIKQETHVNTTNRGQAVLFIEKEILQFESKDSGQLVSVFYHRQQDDFIEQTSLRRVGEYLDGKRVVDNQYSTIHLQDNNFLLSDYLQLMRWIQEDPLEGDILVANRFDLSELTFNTVNYKFLKKHSEKPIKSIEFQESGKNWKGVIELNNAAIPVRFYIDDRVEQRLTSKSKALSENSTKDYYRSQVISIDKPLGDTNNLSSLVLLTTSLPQSEVINDQRQSINDFGELYLSNKSTSKIASQAEVEYFSAIDNDDYLKTLANNIVEGSRTEYEKVVQLLSFVSDYLDDAPVIRPMSVTSILEQRKGDCTEHTQLFIALARTLSIPAREVKGLAYLGDEIQGFGGHVWSEVIINGHWISVDPTWNISQLSATHIQLNSKSGDNIFNKMHNKSSLAFRLKSAEYNSD